METQGLPGEPNYDDHDHQGECQSLQALQISYLVLVAQYLEPITEVLETKNWAALQEICESLTESLTNFWLKSLLCVEDHLKLLPGLKMAYGVDFLHTQIGTDAYPENVVSTVGLYVDTVVLTDPVMTQLRLMTVMNQADPAVLETLTGTLARSIMSILDYREAIMADVSPPLCVVIPDYMYQTEATYNLVGTLTRRDAVSVFSRLTGRSFKSFEKLQHALNSIKTLSDFDKFVTDKAFWSTITNSKAAQPSDVIRRIKTDMSISNLDPADLAEWEEISPARQGCFHITGLLTRINELIYRSWAVRAHPLLTDDAHWNLLVSKNENALGPMRQGSTSEALIARTISTAESNKIKLLSGLPIGDLISLRKQGALHDFRTQLFGNLSNLDARDSNSKAAAIVEITSNIEDALKQHAENLNSLALQEAKFFGTTVVPFLTNTAIAISAFLPSPPIPAPTSSILNLLGLGTLKDLIPGWKQVNQQQKVYSAPASVLFRRLGSERQS